MVQTVSTAFPQSGIAIRAFSSLTARDADAVRATVRAAAACHTVREHDDYDGYLTLLIAPLNEARPSFMVAGRTGAVDVAEIWGDDMMTIGTFASIGAAMAVLRPALVRTEPAPALKAARDAAILIDRHGDDAELHAALKADAQPCGNRWPAALRALDERDEQP